MPLLSRALSFENQNWFADDLGKILAEIGEDFRVLKLDGVILPFIPEYCPRIILESVEINLTRQGTIPVANIQLVTLVLWYFLCYLVFYDFYFVI